MVLHHSDNNFLFWRLYQIDTINNNLNDEEMVTTYLMCVLRFQSALCMLKNMEVLLYTYFYNISLNVLWPNFFNLYNLPFLLSTDIGKIRVKFGPKITYFSYFISVCTNRIAVFYYCYFLFQWHIANQGINKTVAAIFFSSSIFWIIYF